MLVMVARAKVSAVERQLPRAPAQEIKEEEARVTEVALAAPLAKVTEERREEERKEPAAVRVTMMPFALALVNATRKGDGKGGPGFVQIVHLGSLSRYSMQK